MEKCRKINNESGIRLGESFGGLRALKYSIRTVKEGIFPHLQDIKLCGSFDQNLQRNGYQIIYFKSDGNCVPKIIATRIYNDQKKHSRVRREITQYLKCQHEFWGKMRGIQHYEFYLKETFSMRGEPFTPTEIRAASKLYNLPMIYGSRVFGAYTLEGNQ